MTSINGIETISSRHVDSIQKISLLINFLSAQNVITKEAKTILYDFISNVETNPLALLYDLMDKPIEVIIEKKKYRLLLTKTLI